MSTELAQPIGPIDPGSQVFVASILNNLVYVMCRVQVQDPVIGARDVAAFTPLYVINSQGTSLVLNPQVNNQAIVTAIITGEIATGLQLPVQNPVEFRGTRSIQVLYLSTAETRYLYAADPNIPLPQGASTETLKLSSVYQLPPSPGIMFSAAAYTATNQNTLAFFYSPTTGRYQQAAATSLYFLPTSLYLESGTDPSTKQCQASVTDPAQVARIFACSLCPNTAGCNNCSGIPTKAWVNSKDCQNNFEYRYCGGGQYCSSCYGQCASGRQFSCDYNASSSGFACSSPSGPIGPPNVPGLPIAFAGLTPSVPWYRQPWVITLIIVIVIVLIIVLIYFIYYRRGRASSTSSTVESSTVYT